MNRIAKAIVRMMLPGASFLALYYFTSLQIAILVSCVASLLLLTLDIRKERTIKNSNVIGIMGLIFQMISAFFVGYEKFYYVPALVQNCAVMVMVLALCLKSKSVFLYIVKDFEIPIFKNVSDADVLPLNYLWIGYCLLKIISKVIGMIALDFVSLYWLVFFLGTPLNILLIIISYYFVKKKSLYKEHTA